MNFSSERLRSIRSVRSFDGVGDRQVPVVFLVIAVVAEDVGERTEDQMLENRLFSGTDTRHL